eukprot:TRINITY_DN21760_c0_g1_i1.p1 TRINITY_DN21760_c0_g1~~TRINITY_DN21760_c0_g1_i1.p1  ORF type:complete len:128 (-),score=9.41 TRINITY_DN21760_c0_g1_i1:20-403(-)
MSTTMSAVVIRGELGDSSKFNLFGSCGLRLSNVMLTSSELLLRRSSFSLQGELCGVVFSFGVGGGVFCGTSSNLSSLSKAPLSGLTADCQGASGRCRPRCLRLLFGESSATPQNLIFSAAAACAFLT